FQAEFNYVRPYSYQHYRINSNYAHYNQPLAHPLGANFWEAIAFLRYQNKRITAEGRLSYAQHGTDTGGLNYGGNVLVMDINHPNEFGNYVGQGMKEQIWFAELKSGYIINPAYDLRVELGMQFRSLSSAIRDEKNFIIYFGLRTRIPMFYTDY
ncbi:MAG: gliding motility protein RemB, partial [Flavobacteriales bacterium]|nr:gliding motility protein RemB [Flavobacteriales bacterium]